MQPSAGCPSKAFSHARRLFCCGNPGQQQKPEKSTTNSFFDIKKLENDILKNKQLF